MKMFSPPKLFGQALAPGALRALGFDWRKLAPTLDLPRPAVRLKPDADDLETFIDTPISIVPLQSWVGMLEWLVANPWRFYCAPGAEAVLYVSPQGIAACDRSTWSTSIITMRPRKPDARGETP